MDAFHKAQRFHSAGLYGTETFVPVDELSDYPMQIDPPSGVLIVAQPNWPELAQLSNKNDQHHRIAIELQWEQRNSPSPRLRFGKTFNSWPDISGS